MVFEFENVVRPLSTNSATLFLPETNIGCPMDSLDVHLQAKDSCPCMPQESWDIPMQEENANGHVN